MLHIYHEVQSMYTVLGDKILPLKTVYQPLLCEYQTGTLERSKTQTYFKPKNLFSNNLFVHYLTCIYVQTTISF